MKLRSIYGSNNVIAGYIPGAEPKGELAESGPSEIVDITNAQQIADAVEKYKIDTIYNLAALLSAVAESKPLLAWKIGVILQWVESLTGMHFVSSQVYFIDYLPSDIQAADVISVVCISLVLSFLATLYPSWSASRTQPAEALRYE